MKRSSFLPSTVASLVPLLFAIVLMMPERAQPAAALAIGDVVPDVARQIELVDTEGNRASLASLWGTKGALVIFAANTCPYVLDWLDRLPNLAASAAAHDVAFVLVNANERRRTTDDAPEAMDALAKEQGFSFPYWVDKDANLANALDAKRTPEVFLFDGAGALVYQGALDDHSGPLDGVTHHWTRDALDQLRQGVAISTPTTPPLGCAVQRPRRRREGQR